MSPFQRSPEAEAILRTLAQTDLRGSSLGERCAIAASLQDYITATACAHRLFSTREGHEREIDERCFQPEITQLKRILETLEFSPAMHRFLAARTAALADAFREAHPPGRLQSAWDRANDPARVEKLQQLMRMQSDGFGGAGSFKFKPSALDIKPLDMRLRGHFNVAGKNLQDRAVPPVVLNAARLDRDPAITICKSAFHEQLHSLLWQMADAALYTVIPRDHPLYGDAMLMRERVRHGLYTTPSLPGVYAADPEEQACRHYEQLFADRYASPAAPAPGN